MDWWKWRSRGRSGEFMIIPCSLPLRSILLPALCSSSRLSPACTLWHWVGSGQWKPPSRDWKMEEERGQGIYTSSLWFCSSEAAAAAKSLQLCPTLCDPIDGSPPGSPIPGILQARVLEWVAISFSNAWKWKVKVKSLSCVRLFTTPWTAAYQAPPSMGFSRQEYWSGVPSHRLLLWGSGSQKMGSIPEASSSPRTC